MKSLRSESGFAAPLAIVLLAMVCAVSYGAYSTYQAQTAVQSRAKNLTEQASESTPKPKVDNTWKTYSADHYLIRYPSDWYQLPALSEQQTADTVVISNRSSYAAKDDAAIFGLVDSRPGTSRETCYASTPYSTYDMTQSNAKLGTLAATRYIVNAKASQKQRYGVIYLAVRDGNCYALTIATTNAAARDEALDLSARIASTFKLK